MLVWDEPDSLFLLNMQTGNRLLLDLPDSNSSPHVAAPVSGGLTVLQADWPKYNMAAVDLDAERVVGTFSVGPWVNFHLKVSPAGERLVVMARGAHRFRIFDRDQSDTALVRHDPCVPRDPRVEPPHAGRIHWVSDREVVYVSHNRYLVFYDVVDRKRTRIVALK